MENTELKHILIAYKSTNIGLQQAHDEILALFSVSNQRELFDNFYKWLDGLTQAEYDDMSLTDKIEKYFFKN